MFIIRKLILKEWFLFFTGSVLILLLVLSLGHVLNGLLRATNDLKTILYNLFFEIPTFFIKVFPVSSLTASLFSVNKLKSRNELTPIFAGGFSRRHFVLTIGLAGTIVALSLFFINSYLVPFSKHKQALALEGKVAAKPSSTVSINAQRSGKIWFKGKDYFFSYNSFDANKNTLYNLTLYLHNNDYKFSEQVSAASAQYQSGFSWILKSGMHVSNLDNKAFPTSVFFSEKIFQLQETIDDFKKINADISTLSIWKLYDYILVLQQNGINDSEYSITFLDKFSSAFTCLVLAILASIAIFNPGRRNSSFGTNVAFVLSFTFVYWFIYSYFFTLGQTSKIPVFLATFGVPFLFVFYLAFYFFYHRKLR